DLTGGTGPSTAAAQIFRFAALRTLIILLPIFIIGYLVAFLSEYIQVQWKPTAKPLKPKLSKLNPLNGFKRIFSVNSLVELIKSIVKIFLIGYVAYSYLSDRQNDLLLLYDVSLIHAVAFIGETVINLGLRISLIFMIVAVADFAYQKFKFAKDMRMTKQEVKEEFKNQEGNPEIKGRIRQKMREASQRRMMQALPQADVVITNPTHYAVALKYDQDIAPAPFVIAKGEDYLALKIKEVAKEYNIEIVENKPLARMLYANVNIDDQVPPELYSAVADVLAYVYHIQGRI
ncbi:MAG: flagellar biosynthesis protein FlhB, partial [Lachnospiraceae bacterium]|nr:flagellar biosynthesis protein FlhB [Lachnospiraceae bacterium]